MGMTDNTFPVREPRPKKRYQWQDLQGLVSPAILSAPRLDWERMDRRYFQYLIRTVHGDQAPWFEHLVLLTGTRKSIFLAICKTRIFPILSPRGMTFFAITQSPQNTLKPTGERYLRRNKPSIASGCSHWFPSTSPGTILVGQRSWKSKKLGGNEKLMPSPLISPKFEEKLI